jgi:hypothetical protein
VADGDVWIRGFFSDTRYVRGGKVDGAAPGWRDVAEKRLPPLETRALAVHAELDDETYEDLPPIFQGAAGKTVCQAIADVLLAF